MTPYRISTRRRRQVFGAVLLMLSVVVLVVALWGRVRFLSYAALAMAAVGAWTLSRRG